MAFGQENTRLEEFLYIYILGFQFLAYCQIFVYQVGTTNPELAEVKKTRVLEDFVYFYSVEQDLEISKNQVLNAQHWFGSISDHFLQQAQISQHLLSKKKSCILLLTRSTSEVVFIFISVGFESSPWRKDGGAGVRQGDLAAADVQHLKDFSYFDG